MILRDVWQKIKTLGRGETYAIVLIVIVGIGGFGLGRLSKIQGERVSGASIEIVEERFEITEKGGDTSMPASEPVSASGGLLVGSKNSDKYHFPWCSGALRIKEENKVWFSSFEEARAAGYSPAGNCKGLE